ncbi:MAG: hypothetical protein FJ098_15340 [Deltaproteobacteria bacterium]|nr:hypothetical protein [Deltaproteobacteria bacterium]
MKVLATLTLLLGLAAPAGAHDSPLAAEDIRDHLWDHGDRDALAARLGDRLATRTFRGEGSAVKGALAVGVVEAPLKSVLKVVKAYEDYRHLLKFCTSSAILDQEGAKTQVHIKISIANGAVKLWANVAFQESSRGDVTVVEAALEEGNMKRLDARWELAAIDPGRTLVMMRLLVDPDLALASDAKATELNQVNARRAIRAVRERVRLY